VARKLTADLKVQAGRGQYKGLIFEKLKLYLLYKQDVTKIQIDIEGPLEDPKIHTVEAREIGKAVETEVNEPKTILQDVGKGIKEIF
jgi:hypothetical protein